MMKGLQRLSLAEQAALHMQREIEAGRWKGRLPGIARLAEELGISKVKVQEAIGLMEAKGLIRTGGRTKHREIVSDEVTQKLSRTLRVGILPFEDPAYSSPITQEVMLTLTHHLEMLGHGVLIAPKSQLALGCDVNRIRRMIEQHQVDAWVVCRGSAQLLDWFRKQRTPFIAVNGAIEQPSMASVSSMPSFSFRDTVQQLIALGHKRIVWVCSPHWVKPEPIKAVRDFQSQLLSSGLSAGDYNTPYYDGSPEGFQMLLHSLFQLTPPTALIVPCQNHALAVVSFANRRKLDVPGDLSLISYTSGPALHWVTPKISHFHYDPTFLIKRIVRWVEGCAKGMPDQKMELIDATYVAGETVASPLGN